MTRLEGYLTAAAVLGFSIFNVAQSLGHTYNEPYCQDRPYTCLSQEQAVVRETVRHPVIRPLHSANVAPSRHDLVPELAAKVAEIVTTCGSKLVSGFRPHAVVAGTHRASLHSTYPSKAADISGNASCAYALLRNWPGGYSNDYSRVRHIHISFSPPGTGFLAGREWGRVFQHGGGHHRYARHRRTHHV